MHFGTFQERLLVILQSRIRNGEITERNLAKVSGISQPHIHNVLKGKRDLSPEAADRILQQLQISLLDLLDIQEIQQHVTARDPEPQSICRVAVLDGMVGPGLPYPASVSPCDSVPFLASALEGLHAPVAAWLGPDAAMHESLRAHDLALLDCNVERRKILEPDGLYVVVQNGEARVRRLQIGGNRLYLISDRSSGDPKEWETITTYPGRLIEVVRAEVVWIGREVGGRRFQP
jgi:plasmid maintenance system antidote protein VapI